MSIVIPVHNEENWITGCIESFLSQTYKNVEILVVDDASKDRTPEIVSHFKEVKLLRFEKNRGEAAARSEGARQSRGKIIAHTDADAIYPSHYIETAVRTLDENKDAAGLAVGEVRVHPHQKGLIADYFRAKRHASYLSRKAGRKPVVGCVVMRRHVFETIGYYDSLLTAGSDVDFANRMLKAGMKIVWTPELYFEHADPTSWKIFTKRIFNGAAYMKEFRKRWVMHLKGFDMILLVGNIFASLIPCFLLLMFKNPMWGLAVIAFFAAEGIAPLVLLPEQRTMWGLAFKRKKWLLAAAMPLIFFLQVQASAFGKMYAILFPKKVSKSVTFDV
ncbi:MAG: glycosyltransferase [Deltaproteobacteria bacterium]|nr:glycosyltransferase [Deltaproteobacteria bacterium]